MTKRALALSCAVLLFTLSGCNSEGACVHTQSSEREVCVEAGRWDCSGDSYNGTWHAYEGATSDSAAALANACRRLGFEHSFGSGYSRQ